MEHESSSDDNFDNLDVVFVDTVNEFAPIEAIPSTKTAVSITTLDKVFRMSAASSSLPLWELAPVSKTTFERVVGDGLNSELVAAGLEKFSSLIDSKYFTSPCYIRLMNSKAYFNLQFGGQVFEATPNGREALSIAFRYIDTSKTCIGTNCSPTIRGLDSNATIKLNRFYNPMIHQDARKPHHMLRCIYAGTNSVVCSIPIIAQEDGSCPICHMQNCHCPISVMVQETSGAIPNDECNASHCGTLLHDLLPQKRSVEWLNSLKSNIDFSEAVEPFIESEEDVEVEKEKAPKGFLNELVSSMIDTVISKYKESSWLGVAAAVFAKSIKQAAKIIAKNPATLSALGAFAFVLYHQNDLYKHAVSYYQQSKDAGKGEVASVFPLEGIIGILGTAPLTTMFSSLLLMKGWGECLKHKAKDTDDENPLMTVLSGSIKSAGTFVALVSLQLSLINARAYAFAKDPKNAYTPSLSQEKTTSALHVNKRNKQVEVKQSHGVVEVKTQKQSRKQRRSVGNKPSRKQQHHQSSGPVTMKRLRTLERLVRQYGEKTRQGIFEEIEHIKKELKKTHSQPKGKKPVVVKRKEKHSNSVPKKEKPAQKKKVTFKPKKVVTELQRLEALYEKHGKNMFSDLYERLLALRKGPSIGNKPPQCNYCGKMGHTESTCPKLIDDKDKAKEEAEFPKLPVKNAHGKKGGKPYPKDTTHFSYLVDKYDETVYKVADEDVDKFRRWVQMGFQQRVNSGMEWEVSDRDTQDFSLEGQLYDRENYARKKDQHARSSVSDLKNTVQVLDEQGQFIAHGTMFAPKIVGMLKHYFKEGKPTFVSKGKIRSKIVEMLEEVSNAQDYFVFGILEKPMDYTMNKLKVPTKSCRGLMLGMGNFEPLKVDIGTDRATGDKELVYHGVSLPRDCGKAIIDSEDNTIIGLNAGIYTNTNVAFGVPVTENTIIAFESFLF